MKTKYLLIFFLGILTAIICILNVTPPISRDALIHHLYVPKLWLAQGSIAPIPDIVFSYYPMNLDLLYLIPLSFGNDILPKYIHFIFALLTAWLIYNYLCNRLPTPWALFGSLFFLSIPIIIKLSVTVYVDLGVIFFTSASLLSLLKWGQSHQHRFLIIGAICCGLAAGTKYNALISVFLLTLFTPLIYIRLGHIDKKITAYTSIKAMFFCCLYFLVTIITYSPWLMRNYHHTGNPIYPLYQSLFQRSEVVRENPAEAASPSITDITNTGKQLVSRRSSVLANRKAEYHETWWQTLLLPIRFFFEGQDDDPRYFDGKLNPFLLLFMLFAFYHYRYPDRVRREQWFLLAFGWLFFFFTFFQEAMRIRYIATAIPIFTILATFGLHNIYARLSAINNFSKRTVTVAITLLGSAALIYNAHYLIDQFTYYQPVQYVSGKISRDDHLARYLPDYPVQVYANNNLSAENKILAVYVGRRGYYFKHPVMFDPNGGKSKLGGIIRKAEMPEDIHTQLRELGLTHLFIRFDLFSKDANINLTASQIETFNEFLAQQTRLLKANEDYGQHYALFELL
ncbi:ArnT family glycosyltransferase [Thermodesulfobacteriota bacterium]